MRERKREKENRERLTKAKKTDREGERDSSSSPCPCFCRRDGFRSRKSGSGRKPSVHVDDFVKNQQTMQKKVTGSVPREIFFHVYVCTCAYVCASVCLCVSVCLAFFGGWAGKDACSLSHTISLG